MITAAARQVLDRLKTLNDAQEWAELSREAQAAVPDHPDVGHLYAYVAHAMRKLNELEPGYQWAERGLAVEPQNLFVINRVSLLANLTGRFERAHQMVDGQLERVTDNVQDAQNLAVTVSNVIFAAQKLDRIPEAVARLTPIIERLDHDDLHYNSACLYALAHDERVWIYMPKALAAGKPKAAFDELDFDTVRDDPRFAELLARDWQREARVLERAAPRKRDQLRPEDFVDPQVLQSIDDDARADLEHDDGIERAIDADPDDVDGYAVYSDWFQEREHPRGWFIVASRRCDEATTENQRMLAYTEWADWLERHAARLLGPLAPLLVTTTRATWRYGFVSDLEFDVGTERRSGADDVALLAAVLSSLSCRFLRALRIGDIWAEHELDYQRIVDVLLEAELVHLRALAIRPNDDEYALAWSRLDANGLADAFPALESLVLGAELITTGPLVFPALRRFALQTGGLRRANLAAISTARWPMLEELELWLKRRDSSEALEVRDLASILDGRGLGKLRRLRLMRSESTDQLCAALVDAAVLRQLDELDLSMGRMTSHGAEMLGRHARRFAHLATLSVAGNALSPTAAAALVRALPNVVLGTQSDHRHPSADW